MKLNRKKIYSKPELEFITLRIQMDVLALSDPESSISGGGTGEGGGGGATDVLNELGD